MNVLKSLSIALFTTIVVSVALFLFALFLPVMASADDVWQVDELSIEYIDFFRGGRDPLITSNGLPNKTVGQELNLNLNTTLFNYFYLNNTVHSMTDRDVASGGGQFRVVGLKIAFGVRISRYFELGYHHFSRHLLDHVYAHDGFPVQDGIQLKFHLVGNKKESIL